LVRLSAKLTAADIVVATAPAVPEVAAAAVEHKTTTTLLADTVAHNPSFAVNDGTRDTGYDSAPVVVSEAAVLPASPTIICGAASPLGDSDSRYSCLSERRGSVGSRSDVFGSTIEEISASEGLFEGSPQHQNRRTLVLKSASKRFGFSIVGSERRNMSNTLHGGFLA